MKTYRNQAKNIVKRALNNLESECGFVGVTPEDSKYVRASVVSLCAAIDERFRLSKMDKRCVRYKKAIQRLK